MITKNHAVAQVMGTSPASTAAGDEVGQQSVLFTSTERLTERTDLPVAGLPKPEPRHLPLWARLRLLWHRQIVRDAQ